MARTVMNLCLAALLLPGASCWTRFNVGNATVGPNKGKILTCSGGIMSEQIAKNIRGENPDIPVSLTARFPMLNPAEKFFSDFHVYSAVILLIVMWVNFAGPKGNDADPAKAKFHIYFGRLASWLVSPHYALVGAILNTSTKNCAKNSEAFAGTWEIRLRLLLYLRTGGSRVRRHV